MRCEHCKQEMPEGATTCPSCGQEGADLQGDRTLTVLAVGAAVAILWYGDVHNWWHENLGVLGYQWRWGLFFTSVSGWLVLLLAAIAVGFLIRYVRRSVQ